jgi:phosphoribosylanthranilate isomerase
MMVKICGITNREDALAAAECGAGALGFNFFARSPRYIPPEQAAEIIAGLPRDVCKVGVFVNAAPEEILRVRLAAGIDVAQLHGDEPPQAVPRKTRVWKAFRVEADFTPARLEQFDVEAFLLDAPTQDYGGSGRTFEWSKVVDKTGGLSRRWKVILAGGLDDTNVRDAIRLVRPWGVDACSRLETAPGRKDHARVARFVSAALSEEVEWSQ